MHSFRAPNDDVPVESPLYEALPSKRIRTIRSDLQKIEGFLTFRDSQHPDSNRGPTDYKSVITGLVDFGNMWVDLNSRVCMVLVFIGLRATRLDYANPCKPPRLRASYLQSSCRARKRSCVTASRIPDTGCRGSNIHRRPVTVRTGFRDAKVIYAKRL